MTISSPLQWWWPLLALAAYAASRNGLRKISLALSVASLLCFIGQFFTMRVQSMSFVPRKKEDLTQEPSPEGQQSSHPGDGNRTANQVPEDTARKLADPQH